MYVRPPVWICVLWFSTNLFIFNLISIKFDRMLKQHLYTARRPVTDPVFMPFIFARVPTVYK